VNVKVNLVMLSPGCDSESRLAKREQKLRSAVLVKLSHLPRIGNAAKQRRSVLRRNRWSFDAVSLAAKVNCRWLSGRDAQALGSLGDYERQQVSHVILADGVHNSLTTQAQRPGAREATIATTTLPPGSLQRMVRLFGYHVKLLSCRPLNATVASRVRSSIVSEARQRLLSSGSRTSVETLPSGALRSNSVL
jgi:hypothetical protein